MKVSNIRSGQKTDAFSALSTLNYVLNLFGLSCIYKDGKNLKVSKSIKKVVTLVTIFFIANVYAAYDKLLSANTLNFDFEHYFQLGFLLGYFQYISDIFFVYKHRHLRVHYFSVYEIIDQILGISHYEAITKNVRNICICFGIFISINIAIDYASYSMTFRWTFSVIFSIDYVYLGLRLLVEIDIISNIIQVKFRIKTVGDLLERYYCDADIPDVVEDLGKIWISSQDNKLKLSKIKTINLNRHNVVLWLSRCYLFLNEQCEHINTTFGFRILFSYTLYLVDMIFLLNFIIRYIMGTTLGFTYNSSGLLVVSTLIRAIIETLTLPYGLYHCNHTYREVERIIQIIDDLVINKKTTQEIRESLKKLKNLIISKPIKYHALNFYTLDNSTLVSMAGTIVTYTIILLQNMQ